MLMKTGSCVVTNELLVHLDRTLRCMLSWSAFSNAEEVYGATLMTHSAGTFSQSILQMYDDFENYRNLRD
ncbi:hypothetical protein EJ05DRAFT_458978, partial [Pseudovirgaria hyperparasitica]